VTRLQTKPRIVEIIDQILFRLTHNSAELHLKYFRRLLFVDKKFNSKTYSEFPPRISKSGLLILLGSILPSFVLQKCGVVLHFRLSWPQKHAHLHLTKTSD
jgi:hypothetical protein